MISSDSPASPFPYKLHRRVTSMLNQQCWLWGMDVKRPDGNLLLEYGFSRLRPSDGESGSSQYSLLLDSDKRVRLWGFGLYFGAERGIYINRFEVIPRLAIWKDCWVPADMVGLNRALDWELSLCVFQWIASYEDWVRRACGVSYRKQCLLTWKERVCAPEEISENWRAIVQDWKYKNRSSPIKENLNSPFAALQSHSR